MDVQIAQTLFASVDASLNGMLGNGTAKLMLAVGALFGCGYLIHILLKCIAWMNSGLGEVFHEFLWDLVKMSMITFFAFNVQWYINTVVPIVTNIPTDVVSILSSLNSGATNQVDFLIGAYIEGLANLAKAMNFSLFDNLDVMVLGILAFIFMLLGGIPFILVSVGTMITLKVATVLLLSIGPVFIAFSLFPVTRQYFWGWLGVVGGFMLTQILFGVVITLEINFINANVVKNGVIETTLLDAVSILIYFAAFTFLSVEIPGISASIMGGVGTSATGIGGMLGKGLGMPKGGLVRKGAGMAWNRIMNRNRIK
ncbi:type IV secretion system protein [Aeromonas salmonicida]|uniref:type IV secretion system protein n=1 Tax=Aeromonas salmonicida TaxID=645 RepID=UPI000B3F7303|nr:type IV secretion system protein [Aeromonas salmonicida]ARW85332.1 conjugal transfer protein [Aeromonas salmonicida]